MKYTSIPMFLSIILAISSDCFGMQSDDDVRNYKDHLTDLALSVLVAREQHTNDDRTLELWGNMNPKKRAPYRHPENAKRQKKEDPAQ
jgi:hypothetical protein